MNRLLWSLPCAAVLCWPIFWNGFPPVYYDTAIYLTRSGPSLDRPFYFIVWMQLVSWVPLGLYLEAALQAWGTAALLVSLASAVAPARWFLASLLGTPTAFHVVTLMPDFSALWAGLAAALLVASPSRVGRWVSTAVLALCGFIHPVNLFILALTAPAVLLAAWRTGRLRAVLPPLFAAGAVMVAAVPLNNWLQGSPLLDSASPMFLAGRLHQSGALVTSLRVVAVETGNPAYSRWADLAEKVIPEAEPILWSQKSPLLIDFPNWDTDPDQFRAAKAFLAPVVAEGFRSYLTAFLHSTKHNVTSMMRGEYLLGGYPRYGLDSPAGAAVLGLGYDAYRSSRLANRPLLTEEDAPTLFRLWRGLCWASTAWALVAWLALAALLFIRPSPAAGAAFVLLSSVYADLLACGTLSTLATRFLERVVALPAVALVLSLAAVLRRPTSS